MFKAKFRVNGLLVHTPLGLIVDEFDSARRLLVKLRPMELSMDG